MQGLGFIPPSRTGLGSIVSAASSALNTRATSSTSLKSGQGQATGANGYAGSKGSAVEAVTNASTALIQSGSNVLWSGDVRKQVGTLNLADFSSRVKSALSSRGFSGVAVSDDSGFFEAFFPVYSNVVSRQITIQAVLSRSFISNEAVKAVIDAAVLSTGFEVIQSGVEIIGNGTATGNSSGSSNAGGGSNGNSNSNGNTNPNGNTNLLNLLAQTIGVQPTTLMILGIGAGALVLLPAVVGAFRPVRIGR